MTTPPKHVQEFPPSREDLDTMIGAVSHIHLPSAVTGYAIWIFKLSLATAKGAGECEVRVQNLNAMVIGISHIHLIVTSIECDDSGMKKLQVSIAFSPHGHPLSNTLTS